VQGWGYVPWPFRYNGLKLALVNLQTVAEVVSTHEVELAAIVDRRCRIIMYWHSTCVREGRQGFARNGPDRSKSAVFSRAIGSFLSSSVSQAFFCRYPCAGMTTPDAQVTRKKKENAGEDTFAPVCGSLTTRGRPVLARCSTISQSGPFLANPCRPSTSARLEDVQEHLRDTRATMDRLVFGRSFVPDDAA
jgi:hypothetical protein